MNPLQEVKVVAVTPPAAIVDNNSYTTDEIDTLGYDYLQVYVLVGATDIAMAALKLQQSDDTGQNFADVTGAVFGTSKNTAGTTSALPSATDDNKLFCFDVSLKGKKRFFDLVATAGDGSAGTYLTAWAVLSRAKDAPVSAAERGLSQILRA